MPIDNINQERSMKHVPVFLVIILAIAGMIGCTSSPAPAAPDMASEAADAISSATPEGEGWMISLRGVREDELWQSDFLRWIADSGAYVEVELEKRGEVNIYGGIPLSHIVAMVDDPSGAMPYEFRAELWSQGYDITLTASDGYSSTFSTLDVNPEEIFLVNEVDGEAVAPQIAGNVSTGAWVRDLVEIELSLAPVDLAANDFELTLEISGMVSSYTIAELEAMPLYTEGPGQYTNSYGNTFGAVYGGVKLVPLLNQYMEISPETSLTIVAMDGYEMTFGGEMLLDQEDGDWILAFKEDGEYMPEDPGYIRLVKVGPQNPNIDGHASARMIARIVTEDEAFSNFELEIVGPAETETFDRQTMQSGVTTNRNRVTYYDRRSETATAYLGISLWRLLERLDGYGAVTIEAEDGFSITLDNSQLERNDDVILAMYRGENDELLSAEEGPLRLVWDQDAAIVPEGIKSVRNVIRIILLP
jgi:hypothetical protein